MNINENYEEIINFVENLFYTKAGKDFIKHRNDGRFRCMVSMWYKYNDRDHIGTWAASGATKGVIGNDDWDYVIKIPFNDDEYDPIDYCALEVANYNAAEKMGIGNLFAQTYRIGRITGIPIYIQEKVKCDVDGISDTLANYLCDEWLLEGMPYCENHSDDDYDFDKIEDCRSYYLDNIYDSYEMDTWENLEGLFYEDYSRQEIDTLDKLFELLHINDIHSGNVGYRNGKIVLIDFSGYNLFHTMCKNKYKNFIYYKRG